MVDELLIATLFAALAAAVVGGIIGSYIVVKRISFMTGGISHSLLGGIGFSIWLERNYGITAVSPMVGGLTSALLTAWLIGVIHIFSKEREDSLIAALWSFGMALGMLFISQTPGYTGELSNLLLGNLLWVVPEELMQLLLLNGAVILLIFFLHNRLVALCFDEEQARLQGIPVRLLYLFLLMLIAVTVVLLMQVVGVILVMTLLTMPAAIASLFCETLGKVICLSVAMNLFCTSAGLWLAYQWDWPIGATIALVASLCYFLATVVRTKASQ